MNNLYSSDSGAKKYRYEYSRTIRKAGEDIEIIARVGYYPNAFQNPISHDELINQVLELLDAAEIIKITITRPNLKEAK